MLQSCRFLLKSEQGLRRRRRNTAHSQNTTHIAAWIRRYFKAHPVKMSGSMDANFRALTDSLKQCQSFINKKHDVDGLCRSFSDRIKKLIAAKGDRLKY